jgi:hypothetical protein
MSCVTLFTLVLVSGGPARADGDDDETDVPSDPEEPGEPGEPDVEQPPMTAGGLFTLATYPVNEIQRPLTMTEGITQVRLSLGTDLSPLTAFEQYGVSLEGRYGYRDNFMLLGGFTSDYNVNGFSVYGGFEGALVYDILDIRLDARVGRTAQIADVDMNGVPTSFQAGAGVQASVELGFPFRYAATPQIAIVALETLLKIDFNAVERSDGTAKMALPPCATNIGAANCVENGAKPDLVPSLGVATNPIPQLSVVVYAQLQIRDFDTSHQMSLPAAARVQFSPNQRFDIGAEFKFLDLTPATPDNNKAAPSPFDQRFMNLYVQARY